MGYVRLYPPLGVEDRWIITFGDSKTQLTTPDYQRGGPGWQGPLAAGGFGYTGHYWGYYNRGEGGSTIASMQSIITYDIAEIPSYMTGAVKILCNWGANDVTHALDESAWKSGYQNILDLLLAEWPAATIYLTRAWNRGYAANCNTLAGWIADLVTANPGGQVVLGDDERVWLEGGDNGATNTSDGTHYSAAGFTAKVVAMNAVIW